MSPQVVSTRCVRAVGAIPRGRPTGSGLPAAASFADAHRGDRRGGNLRGVARLVARARRACEVTLVDQFEPGDPRATSGGESRLIRCGHGADADYTASARRARTLWRELEAESGEELLVECGLVWFAHRERRLGGAERARPWPRRASRVERLAPEDGRAAVPELPPGEDLAFLLHEPEAGVLRAQRAVRALAAPGRRARRDGRARRAPGPTGDAVAARRRPRARGRRRRLGLRRLARGSCSPSTSRSATTRQELFFFDGGPAWRAPASRPASTSTARSTAPRDLDGLGVKAAPDFDGPPLDPDAALPPADRRERGDWRPRVLASALPGARRRAAAGSKTCRYELSPDSHFVAAPHPEHPSRLAARRRLGPRLQARPGDGRAGRRRAARRRAAARAASGSATRGRGGAVHATAGAAPWRRRRVGAMHDYLIVGAGSAGCALAARLTEDPDVSVLLSRPGRRTPSRRCTSRWRSRSSTARRSTGTTSPGPEPGLDGRELYVPRGRVLGGSSSLNAMIYIRGNPLDYAAWGAGLGLGRRAPYFKRAEDNERGATRCTAPAGRSPSRDGRSKHPLAAAWVEAAAEAGLERNDDFNGPRAGRRRPLPADPARRHALLGRGRLPAPRARAAQPDARARARSSRACCSRAAARSGVEAVRRRRAAGVRAEREVVLSAGAYNSPQLLMLSGVGPAEHLREHGVDVVLDQPAVGANLQDHVNAGDHLAPTTESLMTAEWRRTSRCCRPRGAGR